MEHRSIPFFLLGWQLIGLDFCSLALFRWNLENWFKVRSKLNILREKMDSQLWTFRTGDVIDKIILNLAGPGSKTFGGRKKDIMFVIFHQSILDITFVNEISNGASIYTITRLVGKSEGPGRLNIKWRMLWKHLVIHFNQKYIKFCL